MPPMVFHSTDLVSSPKSIYKNLPDTDKCRGVFFCWLIYAGSDVVRAQTGKRAHTEDGTLTEVFTSDIEENPFEKGFFLKLLS